LFIKPLPKDRCKSHIYGTWSLRGKDGLLGIWGKRGSIKERRLRGSKAAGFRFLLFSSSKKAKERFGLKIEFD
jgi:hypothetical protein